MLVMASKVDDVDANIAWLRTMRDRLGWSTPATAEKAKAIADELRIPVQLSQQAVSAFENGKVKSSPRWLGFVQLAMLDEFLARKLDHKGLFDLRLPEAQAQYFDARRKLILDARAWDEFLPGTQRDRVSLVAETEDDLDADDVEIDMIDLAYGMGQSFIDSDHVEVERVRFSRSWLRQFTNSAPHFLASTRGIGDSMMPTIHDRDVVIIDKSQQRLENNMGDKIWAVIYGGMGMIKRLRTLPDGTVKLSSDNQLIRDELATDGDLFIVGRVIAVVRSV